MEPMSPAAGPVSQVTPRLSPLTFLGMTDGQPFFQELEYDSRNNMVFATAGGELMYKTGHGCLPLALLTFNCRSPHSPTPSELVGSTAAKPGVTDSQPRSTGHQLRAPMTDSPVGKHTLFSSQRNTIHSSD